MTLRRRSQGSRLRAVARALALGQLAAISLAALLGHWLGARSDASLMQVRLSQADAAEVFAWWSLATQNTVGLVCGASVIATLVGGALGASGVYGDNGLGGLLFRLVEFFGAVPALLLAGILRLAEPSGGVVSLFAALTLLRTLEVALLVRVQVLHILPSDFVEASRALGASRRWQLRMHVWPRLLQPLAVNLLLGATTLIGLEAALGFVGLGLPSRVPSWGGGLAALAQAGHEGPLACVIASIGSTCAALYGLAALLDRRRRSAPGFTSPAQRALPDLGAGRQEG